MDASHFLLILALVLAGARCCGELAHYFGIPAVLGELIAGVCFGPTLLNLIQPDLLWTVFSEIGIILLLFEVGLETDFKALTQTGKKPYCVALTGFVLPFILGGWVSYQFFHFSFLSALFVGGTLTATSIGITVRVLHDLKQRHSTESHIVIGAAVVDDLLGILLLAFLYDCATSQQPSASSLLYGACLIVVFMLLAPIAAKLLLSLLSHWNQRCPTPGLLLSLTFAMILLLSVLAHQMGVPLLMGGFAAGLAASREFGLPVLSKLPRASNWLPPQSKLNHPLLEQAKPLIHLFTPIFFVTVGASLNFKTIPWQNGHVLLLTLTLLIAAFVGKLLSGWAVRTSFKKKLMIGISMIPRGEVGLIFAKLGFTYALFNETQYAALILVVAFTTFLPPFLLKQLAKAEAT